MHDPAVVADEDEKLCRLVSKFDRKYNRRKLRANVGKRKVMKCCKYLSLGQMDERLNGEQVKEVNCFKYMGL